MNVQVEISERTVKYGYLYWKKDEDINVLKIIGKLNNQKIELHLNSVYIGLKKIDLSNRRISLGKKITSRLVAGNKIKLSYANNKIDLKY